MNFKIIKEFVIKQHCLPWCVLNWLNYRFHHIYMLLMYLRFNINTLEYWEKRWHEDDYNITDGRISLFKQVASKILPHSFVLDAGCGNGYFMQFLKDAYGIKSFGIDFSSAAIEKLKNKDLEGRAASITNMPFNDNTFDVVTVIEVFEHLNLKSSIKTIKEIRRVCKNSGHVIITVPTFKSLIPQNEPEHLRAYTRKDIYSFFSDYFDEIVTEDSETGSYFIVSGKVSK